MNQKDLIDIIEHSTLQQQYIRYFQMAIEHIAKHRILDYKTNLKKLKKN